MAKSKDTQTEQPGSGRPTTARGASPQPSGLRIEIKRHPATQVVLDPLSGQPICDQNSGEPIREPVIFDQRAVYVNGSLVGYCGAKPNTPLCFIGRFPQTFVDKIVQYVESQIGRRTKVRMPPPQGVAVADEEDE
jgi:hypothetical protein